MRKLFLIFLASLSTVFAVGQSLVAIDSIIDLGSVLESHAINVNFPLLVREDGVVITSVVPDCACTSVEMGQATFNNGDTAMVTVSFNPYNRPGSFLKQVKVLANKDTLSLAFQGFVLPKTLNTFSNEVFENRVATESSFFRLGDVHKGNKFLLRFKNIADDTVFLEVQLKSLVLQSKVNAISIAPKQIGEVNLLVMQAKVPFGFYQDEMQVRLKGKPDHEVLQVQYNYLQTLACTDACPRLMVAQETANYGSVNAGEKKEIEYELLNAGQQPLVIYNAQFPCACLSTTTKFPLTIPVGESVSFKAVFDTKNLEAAQNKVFYLFTNDPLSQVKTLLLKGVIK